MSLWVNNVRIGYVSLRLNNVSLCLDHVSLRLSHVSFVEQLEQCVYVCM
jgi:hypothetical protein